MKISFVFNFFVFILGPILSGCNSSIKIEVIDPNDINDAPIASDSFLNVSQEITRASTLVASDPEHSSLTYSIVDSPIHGSVTITDASIGAFTYTPSASYTGADSFTFKVNDSSSDSNIARVSISVSPPLYFCPNTDSLWATVENWKFDSACTVPTDRLPTDGDSVIITGGTFTDRPEAILLASFVGSLPWESGSSNISIDNNGTLTITEGEWLGTTAVSATVSFNGYSRNNGTIKGDATFNDTSHNDYGFIGGNVIFNDNSGTARAVLPGNVTFNDRSCMNGGEIQGEVTFNGQSKIVRVFNILFSGNVFINSDDTFDNSYPYTDGGVVFDGDVTINGSSYTNPLAIYNGNVNFSNEAIITINNYQWTTDTSNWTGIITWVFQSNAENVGKVIGNATFYDSSTNSMTGVISGNATFNDNSNNYGNVGGTKTCLTTGTCAE